MCKSASLDEIGALLVKWRDADQEISVVFSGQLTNIFSLSCAGKISDVGLTKFTVSWDDWQKSVELRYDAVKTSEISTDGRSLYFIYPSNERLVVSEIPSI
jgi:hypothetical protein